MLEIMSIEFMKATVCGGGVRQKRIGEPVEV